jgi:hypothetical protein
VGTTFFVDDDEDEEKDGRSATGSVRVQETNSIVVDLNLRAPKSIT